MMVHVHYYYRPPVLRDLESLEPAFYNSLVWIQENDPEPLDLTFTIEEEAFDQVRTCDIIFIIFMCNIYAIK